MKSPLFLDNNQDPLNFPGLIYYNLDKTIHIPEKMLPYVKSSLVVNSNTSEEMHGIKCVDITKWKDYTCVYGDSTLLYQGVLYFPFPIKPGLLYQGIHHENNGEGYSWSEPLHISLVWIGDGDINIIEATRGGLIMYFLTLLSIYLWGLPKEPQAT